MNCGCQNGCGSNNTCGCSKRCDPCCNQPKLSYCGKDIECLDIEKGGDLHKTINKIAEKLCQTITELSTAPTINIISATEGQCEEGGYVIQALNPVTGAVIQEAILCNGGSVSMENIYNSDGIQTDVLRTYDADGNSLVFQNIDEYAVLAGKAAVITSEDTEITGTDKISIVTNDGGTVRIATSDVAQGVVQSGMVLTTTDVTGVCEWKYIQKLPILPVYANDAAADADSGLSSGGLYKLTGSRIIYQKP